MPREAWWEHILRLGWVTVPRSGRPGLPARERHRRPSSRTVPCSPVIATFYDVWSVLRGTALDRLGHIDGPLPINQQVDPCSARLRHDSVYSTGFLRGLPRRRPSDDQK